MKILSWSKTKVDRLWFSTLKAPCIVTSTKYNQWAYLNIFKGFCIGWLWLLSNKFILKSEVATRKIESIFLLFFEGEEEGELLCWLICSDVREQSFWKKNPRKKGSCLSQISLYIRKNVWENTGSLILRYWSLGPSCPIKYLNLNVHV